MILCERQNSLLVDLHFRPATKSSLETDSFAVLRARRRKQTGIYLLAAAPDASSPLLAPRFRLPKGILRRELPFLPRHRIDPTNPRAIVEHLLEKHGH